MAYFSNYCGFFFPIITTYVLNQFHGHWLFSDALHCAISLSLKPKDDNELLLFFKSLMEDESNLVNEITCYPLTLERRFMVY
jgi:hypothetical protein